MNNTARFQLAKRKRKVECPSCGKRRFRMFVDTITGELLPNIVGICDRTNSCGYRYTAVEWIRDGGLTKEVEWRPPPMPPPMSKEYRINPTIPKYFENHDENTLVKWLSQYFDRDHIMATWDRYGVGTYTGKEKKLRGATIFWQRDKVGEIRTGEVILYKDGSRSKDPGHHTWVHYLMTKKKADELGVDQCFFGEHLLEHWSMDAWVGIVESAKSALILSMVFPDILWLGSMSMDGLNVRKSMALQGRKVALFPDAGKGYVSWKEKSADIEPLAKEVWVCDILECLGCYDGEDMADMVVPWNVLDHLGVNPLPADKEEMAVEEEEDEDDDVPAAGGTIPPVVARMKARNPAIGLLIDLLDLDIEKSIIKVGIKKTMDTLA